MWKKLNKQQGNFRVINLETYAMAEMSGVKCRKNWFAAQRIKRKKKSMFQ